MHIRLSVFHPLRSRTHFRFGVYFALMHHLGFDERIRGSHHIFSKEGVEEILNLQPKGAMAKPYQVKQVRHVILKYRMGGEDDSL